MGRVDVVNNSKLRKHKNTNKHILSSKPAGGCRHRCQHVGRPNSGRGRNWRLGNLVAVA